MNKTTATIFDMDGVLLNSEPIYIEMNQTFFRQLGADISIEEHSTFVGISATKMWTYIRDKFSLPYSVEELKEMEKELKYQTLRSKALVVTEGIKELLEELKSNGIKIALGTSSLKKNAELILNKLGISHYFDTITTGEDVLKGKPDPDLFLHAASITGAHPHSCVVIEDSTNGIKAAKAAGMTCIAYYNPGSGKQDLSGSDQVIKRFDSGARELIISLCKPAKVSK